MIGETLTGLVGFLALLGAAALVLRLARSAVAVMLRAAEIAVASGMEQTCARRGDLTALTEARGIVSAARAGRRRQLLLAVAWGSWLIIPFAVGWGREALALAAPLWLFPNTGSALANRRSRPPSAS
jgi:hypothetical protein